MSKKIKFETENLPQNIKLVGEKDEKNIYISFNAYRKVHNFTKNKFDNESGGILIGESIEAFNTKNVVIYDFIEAKYTEATKTTLTFTHKTWEYIHKEIEKNYENAKIVGWIHTHPNFGIFLSDYDKFIQNNFFSDENQIAYVVDPIQKIEGFFAFINGNLQKCKGFYIFDSLGKEIAIESEEKNNIEIKEGIDKNSNVKCTKQLFMSILIAFILILDIVLFVYFNNQINNLKLQISTLNEKEYIIPFYNKNNGTFEVLPESEVENNVISNSIENEIINSVSSVSEVTINETVEKSEDISMA